MNNLMYCMLIMLFSIWCNVYVKYDILYDIYELWDAR